MFLSELSPIFKELLQQPLAFTGGFCSGILRLNFNEEPLASWLSKQGWANNQDISTTKGSEGPQSISIE
ncbi:MAG: hypothetical protein AB4206_18775 [Xenococcaceae cyanobacterium]